jgi:hypothetical protein
MFTQCKYQLTYQQVEDAITRNRKLKDDQFNNQRKQNRSTYNSLQIRRAKLQTGQHETGSELKCSVNGTQCGIRTNEAMCQLIYKAPYLGREGGRLARPTQAIRHTCSGKLGIVKILKLNHIRKNLP